MISVIMSIYKEPKDYLYKSIESILNQTYSDFEYIIVLDKPDNEQALKLLQDYKKADNRLIILVNKKNMGLTKSLNRALQIASGDYIARMDADDIAEKNRFEKQMEYLMNNSLDFIGSSMRRITESGKILYDQTNLSYSPKCIAELLEYDNCVPHPSWLLKKSVYDKLGGYKDIKACEDYDFLLRARKAGFQIGICDAILMNYRINTQGISRTNSLKQLLTSDFLQKNLKNIDSIEQNDIDNYLKSKNTPLAANKYEKALTKMNMTLENIKKGHKMEFLCLPLLIFESKYIWINLKKIAKMQKIKRKYL